jgi:sodium/hydrogen exchanger-like protein 6/7
MSNIGVVFILGLFGTFVTFMTMFFTFQWFNDLYYGTSKLRTDGESRLTDLECLLFASIISATDCLAVLTLSNNKKYPALSAILFGEAVLNDALSLLIFDTI